MDLCAHVWISIHVYCVYLVLLILCLLGAEWGNEGVLIDFGHTSLLLKIPWLLLFCSLYPSLSLASSNETPVNWSTYWLLFLYFFLFALTHWPPQSFYHPAWLSPMHLFLLSLTFLISPFLPLLPLLFTDLKSVHLRLPCFLSLCHTFSHYALLTYFVCLSDPFISDFFYIVLCFFLLSLFFSTLLLIHILWRGWTTQTLALRWASTW